MHKLIGLLLALRILHGSVVTLMSVGMWRDALCAAPPGGGEALCEVRYPLTDIRPERGMCHLARIPLLSPNERDDGKTGLRLFEDEVELMQWARPHAEIRELGGGRFSHWGGTLYFSSSDGTSPRENGRRYTIVFNRDALVDASLFDFTPIAPIDAAEIVKGAGFEFIASLPPVIAAWPSDSDTLNGSRLRLLEDGVPLASPHSLLAEIRAQGGGRYVHHGDHVRFSTSDGSDPRENGRRYWIALADLPTHRFIDPLAGKAPATSEVLASPRIAWPRDGMIIDDATPTIRVEEPDQSLLYFWELDVEPTFDSPHLHRQPRVRQSSGAPDFLRALDRDPSFEPMMIPSYRLGALAAFPKSAGPPSMMAILAARLGWGLPTGAEEVREVYEFVQGQLYPVAEDESIKSPAETLRCDRGFCSSVNYLAACLLEELGYRTRRAWVGAPSARGPNEQLYSHSSLEVYFDGEWSIIDPWFGFLLPGMSFQELAARTSPMYPAIRSLAPLEDETFAGDRRLRHLSDYAQQRRYDRFDGRYTPCSDAASERLAFSGEPAVILEPDWRTLWPESRMTVWVRVRSVRLPPEAVDVWMLPRADVNDYRPEVIEVSPWTTVSFVIDLAEAYGFERDE